MRPFNKPKSILAATALSTVVGGLLVIATHAQPRRKRRDLLFCLSMRAFVSLIALLASAPLCHTQEPPSLMTMIAQWQYPGSKMNGATMGDAATLSGADERTVQSIQYKTVLTTKDPMPKVIEYYKTKLMPTASSKTAKLEEKPATDSGRSVTFHDDSEGRPVAIHVILVNTEKASTTLVISRAGTESETHIAWTHYLKLTR
jgi:hypothetical protein